MHKPLSKDSTLHSLPIPGETRERSSCLQDTQSLRRTGAFGILFVLLCMFYTPPTLIWLGIISFKYRFHALVCVLTGLFFYCLLRRFSLHELGFRKDNLTTSMRWNLLFSLIGAVGLYATHKAGLLRPRHATYLPYAYAAYFFILGPVQEIVFRGILFAEMKRIRILDKRWILLTSSLSFCFLHIIYRHPPLLIIAFISGLAWSAIFTKWPNIWSIALSHSLLGALAMSLGVI